MVDDSEVLFSSVSSHVVFPSFNSLSSHICKLFSSSQVSSSVISVWLFSSISLSDEVESYVVSSVFSSSFWFSNVESCISSLLSVSTSFSITTFSCISKISSSFEKT